VVDCALSEKKRKNLYEIGRARALNSREFCGNPPRNSPFPFETFDETCAMRLTLRTILAYMDDVLEPTQAREIGEKIAEGREASTLVSRIRDVIRRRRIGAPELAGPGSGPDPNLVADYLENLLTPNQVVELERLCQSSDVHLAEVACCHKVLTMVLGQQIDVSDEIRERMYTLARSSEVAVTGNTPAMAEGLDSIDADTSRSGLPEYLTRTSNSSHTLRYALLALAGIGWLLLVVTDRGLWTRRPAPALEGELALAPANEAAPAPAGTVPAGLPAGTPVPAAGTQPAANASATTAPGTTPAASSQGTPATAPVAGPHVVPTVPATTPGMPVPAGAVPSVPPSGNPTGTPVPAPAAVDSTMPAAPVGVTETPGQAPLPVAVTPPVPMPPDQAMPAGPGNPMAPPVEIAPVQPEVLPELSLSYQAGDELVIKRRAATADWALADRAVPVAVGDEIASPAPFRNTYRLTDVLTVGLEPGTRIVRLPRTENSEVRILLNRGQLNFFRPFESKSPVRIGLNILGQDWLLTLQTPGTRVGVELTAPVPQGPPAEMNGVLFSGGLVVISGKVTISGPGQPAIDVTDQDGYARWPVQGQGLVLKVDPVIPTWALPDGPLVTPAARQLARMFQKEFLDDRTISQSIGPVFKDRRAGVSDLAVKTLALMDQWQLLVPALNSDHQESRLSALLGLRQILAESPQLEQDITAELGRTFPAEDVEPVKRLLWGFTANDGKSPEISRQLLEWMRDDEVAIREMAFYYVTRLASRDYDYLPMGPISERRAALQRWEDYLKRNGGRLVSE